MMLARLPNERAKWRPFLLPEAQMQDKGAGAATDKGPVSRAAPQQLSAMLVPRGAAVITLALTLAHTLALFRLDVVS